LSPVRSVTDHMEQVIRQTSDDEPCLICCKPMTTRLVPSQGILSLFDPVFNLGTTIVDRNHLVRLKIRVCHNESDTRKEFTHVPFDFTDDPSGIIPSLRLVLELDHPDLYAALWRATGGPLQVRRDVPLQTVVAGKADEVSDPFLLAKLVQVWTPQKLHLHATKTV